MLETPCLAAGRTGGLHEFAHHCFEHDRVGRCIGADNPSGRPGQRDRDRRAAVRRERAAFGGHDDCAGHITSQRRCRAAFEITATFAGALAGALVGVKLRFDLVGVLTLAVISGLGGGIIRDVLLNTEVYALENPRLLIAAIAAALVVFFFFSLADRLQWSLFLVDAVSLGIFAAIGSDKALLAGLRRSSRRSFSARSPRLADGLLRDVLTNDVPQVLRPGGFYASVAVAGCVTYVALVTWLNVVKPLALAGVGRTRPRPAPSHVLARMADADGDRPHAAGRERTAEGRRDRWPGASAGRSGRRVWERPGR